MAAICIHHWLNECKKKFKINSIWVLCLRWRGAEFLNCLHCSALALLLHSAIKWPIQYQKKGFAEFLNQKRWHPSVILRAKTGEWGKALSVACGVEGEETRLRPRRAVGFSYSITIGSRGGATSEPQQKEGGANVNVCQREGGTKSHPLQISIRRC